MKVTIQRPETVNGNGSERLKNPLVISAAGHVFLVVVALWGALAGHTEMWGEGSGGGAANLRLVSAASIPLPPPLIDTTNKLANQEPGLHQSEAPKPQPKPEVEKAIELPGKNVKRAQPKAPPPPVRQQARAFRPDRPLPPPSNEIPYGAGGPPTGPYGMFRSDAGTGGFAFSQNSGDFGSRFGWYVTAMRNRISGNWLQSTVDPNIRSAPRVYVTFVILRDGQIVSTQMMASSGITSLDRSVLRAIADSNPMPPLPDDYRGGNVAVEFWFDFRR
jgi:TonB family protein